VAWSVTRQSFSWRWSYVAEFSGAFGPLTVTFVAREIREAGAAAKRAAG
jgi:hypothetical protein